MTDAEIEWAFLEWSVGGDFMTPAEVWKGGVKWLQEKEGGEAFELARDLEEHGSFCPGCGMAEGDCQFAKKEKGAIACCPDCKHYSKALAKYKERGA